MRSKLGVQVLGSVEGHAKPVSCAVPVQETDQEGALEANEWQAGSGPKSPNSEGKAHSPSSPQAIQDPSLPSQSPPSQASHLPWSPERQSLKGTQKSGLFSDLPCSWDTQVGGAGGQANVPRQGSSRRGRL